MKTFLLLIGTLAVCSGTRAPQDNVEFVCLKTHKASNTCYFNFKVDGAKYTYVDKGCKKTKKKDETITKVKEGELALSRDWKIECPEQKQ
ncbi:MAG TPA: hypothetical protein VGD65_12630 [Chryseosolibacter sp.]